MGRLNATSSAGFIVGPMIGGYVSSLPHGFNYTAMLTTATFAVNYALIATFYTDEVRHARAPKGITPTTPMESSSEQQPVNWQQVFHDAKAKMFEFKNVIYETGPAKTLLVARLLLASAALVYR